MAEVAGVKWHVVADEQRLTSQITNTGSGFRDVWEVPYMIDSGPAAGLTGIVRIPADQYNAEVVKATINAIVQHNHAVGSL
jgi:hypothetical protein